MTNDTSHFPVDRDDAHPPAASAPEPGPTALRLGFARGVAPSKWAGRWAVAVPTVPLELVPLTHTGAVPQGEAEVDVKLERVAPGMRPAGSTAPNGPTGAGTGGGDADPPPRFAVHLYTEAVALVVPADHELASQTAVDHEALGLVTLLGHPGHFDAWPAAAPWQDPSWAPRNLPAALELVESGLGGILLPLPLARHVTKKRAHAVLAITGDPLPGTEIWATWERERDAGDVQQLIGIMRGRTARSERPGAIAPAGQRREASDAARKQAQGGAGKTGGKAGKKSQPPKNSRGAQLAAAQEKREAEKRARQKQKQRQKQSQRRRGR